MKNTGKRFEADIKSSIPENVLLIRLPDPPQAFERNANTRFSHKNPCDYICYDSNTGKLWCLELKTTSAKSMGFEDIYTDKQESKMIHRHQTKSLLKFSAFNGVVSGFLFNFRHNQESDDYNEMTYFMEAPLFQKMCDNLGKKSFNEIDIILNGAIKVLGQKKRTRYSWDMASLFSKYKVEVTNQE